ncbi:MAG: YrhK family protein [Halodesulfovibrio sp.]|uniref:YrhK family protein n=1 Tax=Halodesulfovibrio sp. TaxID=1912772 RepID=UPI00359D6FDE
MNISNKDRVEIELGQKHIIIQRRYEAVGAFNDLLIAIWFLIGSFFFLSSSLVTDGTWLFIAGSAQLLIKPCIKLTSLIHVNRVLATQNSGENRTNAESSNFEIAA